MIREIWLVIGSKYWNRLLKWRGSDVCHFLTISYNQCAGNPIGTRVTDRITWNLCTTTVGLVWNVGTFASYCHHDVFLSIMSVTLEGISLSLLIISDFQRQRERQTSLPTSQGFTLIWGDKVHKWASLVASMASQHSRCYTQASLFMSLQGYFWYHRFLRGACNMRGYIPCRCKTITASKCPGVGWGGALFLLGLHKNLVCICVSEWQLHLAH